MDSNDYDEKKEAALVIGLLIKCNKFKSLQFPLKWDEYINQADISIEDLNE